jgi:hypothetical protein
MGWIDALSGKVVGLVSFFLANDSQLPSLPELEVLVLGGEDHRTGITQEWQTTF